MARYTPLQKWEKFGRLTALWECELREYWRKWARRHYEYFICDCWNKVWVKTDYVKRWHTQSCWCYARDCTIKRSTKHWWAKKWVHDKLYDIYCGILERCNNENSNCYWDYWWRWIKCLWNSYEEFKADMWEWYLEHVRECWEKDTQIDRINNNWNYCKENCRRVTRKENSRNRRSNIFVERRWQKMILIDVYNKSNPIVKYSTFMYRYHHWWDLERALYTPVQWFKL